MVTAQPFRVCVTKRLYDLKIWYISADNRKVGWPGVSNSHARHRYGLNKAVSRLREAGIPRSLD